MSHLKTIIPKNFKESEYGIIESDGAQICHFRLKRYHITDTIGIGDNRFTEMETLNRLANAVNAKPNQSTDERNRQLQERLNQFIGQQRQQHNYGQKYGQESSKRRNNSKSNLNYEKNI
ncbi:hypothetical protein Glove_80g27 [Diversispora epigaea]|uniref:Uncharacterized protein n=1 Tax=Diversispora epigaea TaxID=1348612 RepID=A0A397JBQ0_9GLOM|nr:hypothetical protein Glove_80g27 [Diversispora epigaea]